jgi:hypothetical protein
MKVAHFAATLVALGLAGAARAETFTFANTSSNLKQVALNASTPGGRPSGAAIYDMKSITTYPDGHKVETNGACAAWILPAGDTFGQNGVCQFHDASGPRYDVRFTCAAPQTSGALVDCWGALIGTGGPEKGKSGAFTGHNTQTGINGEGHW